MFSWFIPGPLIKLYFVQSPMKMQMGKPQGDEMHPCLPFILLSTYVPDAVKTLGLQRPSQIPALRWLWSGASKKSIGQVYGIYHTHTHTHTHTHIYNTGTIVISTMKDREGHGGPGRAGGEGDIDSDSQRKGDFGHELSVCLEAQKSHWPESQKLE